MPYELLFERVATADNVPALELNKALADTLISIFPDIEDLNPPNSSTHFRMRELDMEDEFPEKHFTLYAEIAGMNFGFDFWQNAFWLELGAADSATSRFAHVRQYAVIILQQGFRFGDNAGGASASLEEGLAWHLREYQEWTGFVKHVTKITARKESAAE
ncbi:MAG: hypothetical protein ACRYF0_18630 [Janthinobacterium lividum]